MATWKELKAQGVKRCCAMFVSGKQCRRRAADGSSWCAKHGPVIETKLALYNELAKVDTVEDEKDDE